MRIAKGEGQSRGCGDNRARTIAKIRPLLITYLSEKRDEVAEAALAKDWEVVVSENQKKARDSTAGEAERRNSENSSTH